MNRQPGRLSRRFLISASLLMVAACAAEPVEKPKVALDQEATLLATDLHRDHGQSALHAERYADAASYFNRILKSQPGDLHARLGLGEARLGQGRLDDALQNLKQLDQQLDTKKSVALKTSVLQGQGLVWLRKGDREKARTYLDQAIDRDPDLWRSWNALGRVLDAEKDHRAARAAYRRAIDLNPKAAFLHNNLGFSLLASGDPVYAEASFKRALDLDPKLDIASANLRLALAFQGRYGPALAGAEPSDRAAVMNNVGYAALMRGDHEKARSLFLDAMAADPGFFGEAKQNLAYLEALETDPGGDR